MSKTTFVRLQTWLLVAVLLALLAACAPAPTAYRSAATSTNSHRVGRAASEAHRDGAATAPSRWASLHSAHPT